MKDLGDFGRYLQQQRELRGLTRDDVAKSTRLSPSLVAALEDGQAERLPEPVFVQKHVQAYARAVGLPEDDVLNRLLAIPGFLPPTERSPQLLEATRRTSAYKGLAVFLALLALGVLALWWWKEKT